MAIEVLRIGQRVVRDDRVTTHVALVARAFGAARIYMNEVNPEIKETIDQINTTWGGSFEVKIIESWKKLLREKKPESKIVHLTMYGSPIGSAAEELAGFENLLVVVGAEKVPRDIYELADYNVSVGNQPHSEISALAILLDRIQRGAQFGAEFAGAQRKIIPNNSGKTVEDYKTSD